MIIITSNWTMSYPARERPTREPTAKTKLATNSHRMDCCSFPLSKRGARNRKAALIIKYPRASRLTNIPWGLYCVKRDRPAVSPDKVLGRTTVHWMKKSAINKTAQIIAKDNAIWLNIFLSFSAWWWMDAVNATNVGTKINAGISHTKSLRMNVGVNG